METTKKCTETAKKARRKEKKKGLSDRKQQGNFALAPMRSDTGKLYYQ